jgi:hypothetical protein
MAARETKQHNKENKEKAVYEVTAAERKFSTRGSMS